MNRGLLISLLVVAVAATAAVLFFPGGDTDPLDPIAAEGGENTSGGDGPGNAQLENNGSRTESQNPSHDDVSLEADPTTIVGQVRAADSGKVLPNARLVYSHRQFGGPNAGWSPDAVKAIGTHCDRSARFRMPSAGPQEVLQIVAWAPGYSVTRVADLKLGQVIEIDLHPTVQVTGSVFDPQGRPAARTKVKLFDPKHGLDGYPITAITDENGNFQIAASRQSDVSLEVRAGAGSALLDRSLDIRDGMSPIEVVLEGDLSLTGTVTDDVGRPVAGASLILQKTGERLTTEAAADEDGKINVFGLESGEWTCEVGAEGFASQKHPLIIGGGGPETLHCTLFRNSSLRVIVTDGKQRPLPGAYLQLLPNPNGEFRAMKFPKVASDAEGIAIFPQVPPGQYAVGPESTKGQSPSMVFEAADGHVPGKGTAFFSELVDVLPGQEAEVRLVLKRHGVLTVTVLRDGQPVSGARGMLSEFGRSTPREREANDLSDLDGQLIFPAVWMGDYLLEVQGSPSEITTVQEISTGRGVNAFTVELPDGSVGGKITAGGKGLIGARLFAARAGDKFVPMGVTQTDGSFELRGFDAGEYKLRIESDSHLPWSMTDLKHDGSHVDLGTIVLETSCRLAGTVTGLKSNPNDFIGPIIHALDAQGNGLATRPINSNGTFVFESLPSGSVLLRVVSGGRNIHSQTVQLPVAGDKLTIKL